MEQSNDTSVTRPSVGGGSEGEFDDELGVPESLKIVDIGDGPVVIEHSDEEVEDETIGGLEFSTIHNPPYKFKSFRRNVFLPGVDITVTITDYERNLTSHMINPNLYTLSFVHGNFNWTIKKRYKQIQHLHQQLLVFRAGLNIPLPSKTHKRKRKSFKVGKVKRKSALPRFPKKPEILVPYDRLGDRMKQLENYLNNLLSINIYRNHPATIEFLEVSHLSFIQGLGIKGKEGMVKKRTRSTQPGQAGCNYFGLYRYLFCVRCQHLCNDICARWVERWFFLKDTCFGYINPEDGRVNCVVLFDQGFEIASGMYSIGLQTGFHVLTLSRTIAFKCWTRRKSREWIEALREIAATTARDFTQPNPHHSFAPIRTTIPACWFVDGSSYMSAVADAIENAKEEIFITDWWLSPEIYLKRPTICGDHWRLDRLLQRKAEAGVKIFVLLYKEVEMALGLNSYYSKQRLVETSDNIKVLRHPDHARAGIFLWAHHEKIVVVDQSYAFVGGIDLCYGRWDDAQHRLTDLGSITPNIDVSTLRKKTSSVPSGDVFYPIPTPIYKQTPIPPINECGDEDEELDRIDLPQLEPGDHLLIPPNIERMKCNTPDMERKNMIETIKNTVKNKSKDLINLVYNPHEGSFDSNHQTPTTPELKHTETPEDILQNLNGSSKLWIGKDYCNFIVQDFNNLDSPFDDFIDRVTTPRMPWHDMGVCVQGATARDISRHFIQRWNATKLEKAKSNTSYPYLLPKSYEDYKTFPMVFPNEVQQVTCQVLRSVSTWSCGFLEPDTVEQSIHEAYIDSINRAQYYVYIENQFFISLAYNNPNTKNQIAEALYKRIIRAHKAKEVFRVYVIMPLLPGFEGEVGGASGTSLHAITHWNYASISQGKDAILNRLKTAGIDNPNEYISFYGLRNHSILNGEPITELIYVHSKLMIIDDRIVICGSANINDRSMIGKRDSEIALLIQDEFFDDGIMNGQNFPCGKFAGNLRKYLFKEHLGLLGKESEMIDYDITDPISDYFFNEIWYKTASLNTEFFEKVFHCIPTDKVETFTDLKRYQEEKPLYTSEISRSEKMLESIQGHLVLLPLNFLCKENLTPAASSVEGMMPTSLWT